MPLTLPYAHLNLCRNPFGEVPLHERAALAVLDLGPLLSWLSEDRRALQLIGESGRGKTTRLLALRSRHPQAPYVRIPIEAPFPVVSRAELLLVDELQHLPRRRRRRLYGRAQRLAIGTHEDLTDELREAGYDVKSIEVGGELDLDRLEAIVTRRLEWARRGAGSLPTVSRAACQRLLERFGDDLRGIEHHLYERVQCLEGMGDVEV